MSQKYWASEESSKIGNEIKKRVEGYQDYLLTSGRRDLWRKSVQAYYRPAMKGGQINKAGEQGEYSVLCVNHFHNLLSHLLTMTVSSRAAFEPRATNTDHTSQAQTILASGLLDYYMREKKLERHIKTAVETALLLGEGFVMAEWEALSGEIYGKNPETGAPVYEGDIKYTTFSPQYVARDYTKKDSQSHQWYIVSKFTNKFDLAAKFPELEDTILNQPTRVEHEKVYGIYSSTNSDSDDIVVNYFVHQPTAALENGRLVTCLNDGTVLLDGPLPYRQVNVYRISPSDMLDSILGYTVGFDLLPVQEAIDALYSTVYTNQSTFGVQNVLAPQGHNISVSELAKGMNLIEYDSKIGKPESFNLTNTPPEIFNFIQMLEKLQETISGVNSVARGNPEASLKSGAALALVQSMAIQFSIGLQQSYSQLLEDLGTSTINMLRDFASVPRVAMIAGKSQRSLMKQFKGDDLSMINRVVVDQGNALSRTTSGRVQLSETLLQNGMVKTASEYIQVLTTGRLEPIIEGQQAELLNIRAENEELANGVQVPVIVTDEHLIHIQEHKAVIASPEARRDPSILNSTLQHINEHLSILNDPAMSQMLQALGQQSMAPMPATQPSPASSQLDATNPLTQEAANVKLPSLPVIPLA